MVDTLGPVPRQFIPISMNKGDDSFEDSNISAVAVHAAAICNVADHDIRRR